MHWITEIRDCFLFYNYLCYVILSAGEKFNIEIREKKKRAAKEDPLRKKSKRELWWIPPSHVEEIWSIDIGTANCNCLTTYIISYIPYRYHISLFVVSYRFTFKLEARTTVNGQCSLLLHGSSTAGVIIVFSVRHI